MPQTLTQAVSSAPVDPDQLNYKAFNSSSYTGPTTQDLTNRANSLFCTLFTQLPQSVTQDQKLAELQVRVINEINTQFDIDEGLKNKAPKARYQYLEKTCKKFQSYLNKLIFIELVPFIQQPGESELAAAMRLREMENNYVSSLPRPAPLRHDITIDVDGQASTHFSEQIRLEETLQNCYKRKGGIANLRKQSAGHFDGEGNPITDIEFYRHTSVVPIQIEDPINRLACATDTVKELLGVLAEQQFLREMQAWPDSSASTQFDSLADFYNSNGNALKLSLTEIRLLSVLNRRLAFMDKEQQQFQQTLEAYFAFNMCDQQKLTVKVHGLDGKEREINVQTDISFMDLGVNWFSFNAPNDPLQNWINTRGFNQLYDQLLAYVAKHEVGNVVASTLEKLESTPALLDAATAVNKGRADLAKRYAELQSALQPPGKPPAQLKQQIKAIEELIKAQHSLEAKLLTIRKNSWQVNGEAIRKNIAAGLTEQIDPKVRNFYQVLQDFADAQDLYFSGKYNTAEHNYKLQALLVDLNCKMGRTVGTGCNDAKDRDSRLSNTIETLVATQHRNKGINPVWNDKPSNNKFNFILNLFHRFSTSLPGSENSSVPGNRGFELHRWDGNGALDLENSFVAAQLGKKIYEPSLTTKIKHEWAQAKRWLNGNVFNKLLKTLKLGLLAITALLTVITLNPALGSSGKDLQSRDSSIKETRKYDAMSAVEASGGKQKQQRRSGSKPGDDPFIPVPVKEGKDSKDTKDSSRENTEEVNETVGAGTNVVRSSDAISDHVKTTAFLNSKTATTQKITTRSKKEQYLQRGSEQSVPITDFIRNETQNEIARNLVLRI